MKREQGSSQSDEESDSRRERRKRKKSRWGNDPPVDIKPPGMVAPFPTGMPGTHNIILYTISEYSQLIGSFYVHEYIKQRQRNSWSLMKIDFCVRNNASFLWTFGASNVFIKV